MNSRPPLQWHTRALAATLGLWAIWLFVGVFRAAALGPLGMLGPGLLCAFMSLPLLVSAGAYLLYTGNKLRIVPFLLLPFVEFWTAIELYPDQLNPQDWEIGASYLEHFPLGVRINAGLFAACAVYCLFLNRRESVYMVSDSRQSGRDA